MLVGAIDDFAFENGRERLRVADVDRGISLLKRWQSEWAMPNLRVPS